VPSGDDGSISLLAMLQKLIISGVQKAYGQDYVLRLMFANFNEINRSSLNIRSELSLCTNTGSVVEPTEPGSWQVEKYNSPMLASRQSKLQ